MVHQAIQPTSEALLRLATYSNFYIEQQCSRNLELQTHSVWDTLLDQRDTQSPNDVYSLCVYI